MSINDRNVCFGELFTFVISLSNSNDHSKAKRFLVWNSFSEWFTNSAFTFLPLHVRDGFLKFRIKLQRKHNKEWNPQQATGVVSPLRESFQRKLIRYGVKYKFDFEGFKGGTEKKDAFGHWKFLSDCFWIIHVEPFNNETSGRFELTSWSAIASTSSMSYLFIERHTEIFDTSPRRLSFVRFTSDVSKETENCFAERLRSALCFSVVHAFHERKARFEDSREKERRINEARAQLFTLISSISN